MLGILAIILLIIWIGGLMLHLLGGFIHIVLLLAVIFAVAHFLRPRRTA